MTKVHLNFSWNFID